MAFGVVRTIRGQDGRKLDPKKLRAVLEENGLSFKSTGDSYVLDCPKCLKKNKLYIYKENGRFVCWYCKETERFVGKPEYVIAELLGITVKEAHNKLYDEVELKQTGSKLDLIDPRSYEVDELPDLTPGHPVSWPEDYLEIDQPLAEPGLKYLKTRNIDLDLAQKYGLRYCLGSKRVIFPITQNGVLYGWQGRLIEARTWTDPTTGETRSSPKVLTSRGVKRDRVLMFGDRLRGSEHVVLCEGPVDAIAADLCGGNVATMGKAVSKLQVDLVRASGVKRVYLGLDPDAGKEMERLLKEFYGLECYCAVAPKPYKDLGEMPHEEVYDLFKTAKRLDSRSFVRRFR